MSRRQPAAAVRLTAGEDRPLRAPFMPGVGEQQADGGEEEPGERAGREPVLAENLQPVAQQGDGPAEEQEAGPVERRDLGVERVRPRFHGGGRARFRAGPPLHGLARAILPLGCFFHCRALAGSL